MDVTVASDGRTARSQHRIGVGLVLLGLLVAVVGVGDATAATAVVEPVVEAARQVSADPRPARLYPIPELAVDPTDPDTVVIASAEARFGGCRLYVSRDGGLTWLETAQDMLIEPYDFCIRRPFGRNVAPVFTADGERLYVGFGGADKDGTEYPNDASVALLGSTEDLGLTMETTLVADSQELQAEKDGKTEAVRAQHDMASVAVDPNDNDVVYRGWRQQSTMPSWAYEERPGFPRGVDSIDGLHTMVAVSTDGGATWGEAIDLTRDVGGEELTPEGSDVPVLVAEDDGTIHAFTRERRPGDEDPPQPTRILQFTSTDQGQTWEMSEVAGVEGGLTVPDAAIDPSTGDLHLVYEVQRAVEGAEDLSTTRIEFITSSDGGETWTEPVDIVDPDAIESANQYFPGISVAPDGRIDVAWWDFRDDPFWSPGEEGGHDAGERYAHVYYGYSLDGGRTWSRNLRVTDRLVDHSLGVAFAGATRGPIAMGSAPDAAYVAWSDTRAADAVNAVEDVYMTRVRMEPGVVASASAGDRGDPRWVGIALGAGLALAVAGAALLLARRRRGTAS